MLDSKLQRLRDRFGIWQPADWCSVTPAEILTEPGVSDKTLDYIRVLLAGHNLTLKGDRSPEYWRRYSDAAAVGGQTLGDPEEGRDRAIITPYTVLIDSAEQQPFDFSGLRAGGRPLIVQTEVCCLGRHPDSFGDYSLAGFHRKVGIERKSVNDFIGTVLGWGGGRNRFERELSNLAGIDNAAVVVEGTIGQVLDAVQQHGKKTVTENRKIITRSVISWQLKYKGVQWVFCDSRALAQIFAFRFLDTYWRHCQEAAKERQKSLAVPVAS